MSVKLDRRMHLAEMLLHARLHGRRDGLRAKLAFSEDIESMQAVLFSSRYDTRKKVRAYRSWLETKQPCVFGRIAAKNKNVYICLLDETDVLRMRRGDDDLRDTIQDYRQAWKRHALDGLSSSFVILLVSRTLVEQEPGDDLKEVCRRLMELYMEIDQIEDDTFRAQREYVFFRQREPEKAQLLKFSTLPNVFAAQGDGRWWHDHRTPGGIMITSNALGHFMYSRTVKTVLDETTKLWALENAMRTINNAYRGPQGRRVQRYKHCPATFLVNSAEGEKSPLPQTSDFRRYSADHYEGFFHTDHLIPSVYFHKEADPAKLPLYENLTFRYIYDSTSDPEEHAELMTGAKTTWYDVKRNIDRLPSFADPEKVSGFPLPLRARLARWLAERLQARLGA